MSGFRAKVEGSQGAAHALITRPRRKLEIRVYRGAVQTQQAQPFRWLPTWPALVEPRASGQMLSEPTIGRPVREG